MQDDAKTDIARLKGKDFDYNANNRLTKAIFDTLLGGTGHTVFTNKLSSAYNNFTSLSLSQQKAYDVHTLLDMAIYTYTPLYRTKKWNWSPNACTNHDDMQMVTALTSEIRTLQNDLQKLQKNQHFESDTKNEQKERNVQRSIGRTTLLRREEGDPQTFNKIVVHRGQLIGKNCVASASKERIKDGFGESIVGIIVEIISL